MRRDWGDKTLEMQTYYVNSPICTLFELCFWFLPTPEWNIWLSLNKLHQQNICAAAAAAAEQVATETFASDQWMASVISDR